MDLEGAFLALKGVLLHSLPKSGVAMALLAPPVPTSLNLFVSDVWCYELHCILALMLEKD